MPRTVPGTQGRARRIPATSLPSPHFLVPTTNPSTAHASYTGAFRMFRFLILRKQSCIFKRPVSDVKKCICYFKLNCFSFSYLGFRSQKISDPCPSHTTKTWSVTDGLLASGGDAHKRTPSGGRRVGRTAAQTLSLFIFSLRKCLLPTVCRE